MRRGILACTITALFVSACGEAPTQPEALDPGDLMPLMQTTSSNGVLDQLPPFTQEELDDNWIDDRSTPSGGVESVSAFGRDDVARIGIDSDDPTADAGDGFFWRTEGIRRFGDFGTAIHVDLYLDPDWEDQAVRAGFWVAGYTEDDVRSDGWGIFEFTTADSEVIGSGPDQAEISRNERWRAWVSGIGWTDLNVDIDYGEWASIEIILDETEQAYEFFLDGEPVFRAEIPVDDFATIDESTHIGEVFLNHYNYGHEVLDPDAEAAGFTLVSYDAHWHNGDIPEPLARDDCMGGGWEAAGFRNQGQCIRFVNTGKDSR